MLDHVLGRPSVKSRRLQVLAVLSFWSFYVFKGDKHGPPVMRTFSKLVTKKLTAWQTVVLTMIYLYAARNFSTLVGLASPEPMSNMYDATFFRATWVLTALDAGFWTAMKIKSRRLRDLASIVFSVFYLFAAEKADEKVRKVRGMLTVDHLRVSWNKGTTPYLSFFQKLMRPRLKYWPPIEVRIRRPADSDYKEPIHAWLYFHGSARDDLPAHDSIVMDIPGGGFVAMDPRCNDDKLSSWAAKTGLPILAIDYKKAPEFPYPYAINECYDAYVTIMKTKGRCIGLSGHKTPKIVFTGDSAGGNLAAATALMVIERSQNPMGRNIQTVDIPLPDGLVLFYPALDMNIGNWMSEEQMSLIRDRRLRRTNKSILRRKSRQYNDLVGTPVPSDDEDDGPDKPTSNRLTVNGGQGSSSQTTKSTHPEYSHGGPQHLNSLETKKSASTQAQAKSPSHHPELLHTRLAVSSMLSYFNDRVLTPEMMRAMIILYIGPHNQPDFQTDYLLSPVLAPDALLAHFPKTYFLTGERDPLVDDTVIFAGRLRKVKQDIVRRKLAPQTPGAEDWDDKDVAEVNLIPGISHGFLQFPTVYPPAWKLMARAAGWIEDVFAHAEQLREEERFRASEAGRTRRRQPPRSESSGEEDRPLMMTRLKRRTSPTIPGQVNGDGSKTKEKGTSEVSWEVRGDTSPYEGNGTTKGTGDRKEWKGKKLSRDAKRGSMVRLGSEDDLLSRRMGGLVSGLTRTGEDD